MTATSIPARSRPARTAGSSPVAAGRLLWVELRRNAMILMLPLLAVLVALTFFLKSLSATSASLWGLSASYIPNHLLRDFAMFAAGVAAWMGAREGRRHVSDLVVVTPRAGWARRGATLAATMCWVMAAYLACVGVQYGVTAGRATWGGPPLWPVAVSAAGAAAACAFGFAAGAFFPSRFTAPLAALAGFFPSVGIRTSSPYGMLWPTTWQPAEDVGTFYHYLPDVSAAQVMFLGGIAVAALGVLGLPAVAGGRRLRVAAAVVTVAGLAAAGTATGLIGTARPGANGMVIPALHDAASDRPVPYTPVCRDAAARICVHPAFRAYLGDVTAALDPVFREVAGLPGAPAGATQTATNLLSASKGTAISGTPPGFRFALFPPSTADPGSPDFAGGIQDVFLATFIAGNAGAAQAVNGDGYGGTPAQQAIEDALLNAVDPAALQSSGPLSPLSPEVSAAVKRFAAVPAATRHAWLGTHLPALRAGHVTLAQIP